VGSQNNTPDVTTCNSVSNAVSCYRQYSSVLPLLWHCAPVFDDICGIAMNFVFLLPE